MTAIDTMIARLDAAIATAPRHMDGAARMYRSRLARLRHYGDDPYVLGLIGPNGLGPGIEDTIRQCRSRPTAPDAMPGVTAFNRKLAFPHTQKDDKNVHVPEYARG